MSTLPDWARVLGPPLLSGRIRCSPQDFVVTEIVDIDFSDDGEHDWLWIEKTGANTAWVAGQLARHAGLKERDVGYAGLKDRHAVTRQWFSVRRPSGDGTNWDAFKADGVEVLERRRHHRKLKRGAHKSNSFRIAVRSEDIDTHRDSLAERLQVIAGQGVPNYFGEQRFGHDGANIELGRSAVAGRRLPRHKRSIGISALRSLEFNNGLSSRIDAGTWNLMQPGEKANLDGTGSLFDVDEVTPDITQRCAELDIHPVGVLPGIDTIAVAEGYRPLRMRVINLDWDIDKDALWLEFSLSRGCYATAVLRELVDL